MSIIKKTNFVDFESEIRNKTRDIEALTCLYISVLSKSFNYFDKIHYWSH